MANNTTIPSLATRGSRVMQGPGDAVWILTSAFIIFTMISGFGLVESGMVSRKNEANIMVKNAIDVIFGGLGFWMFGFSFTFGHKSANGFCGFGNFFTDADESKMGEVFSLYLFQASFATTATTIVSGAVAERMNLKAYSLFAFTNTITYCFPAHWVWGDKGWLKEMGVVDMGGASPVHLVGGVAGLVATLMLKPRTGRYKNRKSWNHVMASPTNVLLGMFMLWWGWLGFNCGSTFGVSGGKWKLASRSAVCTLNASAGGGVFVTFYSYKLFNRLDIPLFMSGILGSLVSITAICGVVRPGESIIIGFIGAIVATTGWQLLERFEIDDPVGAVSIHAGGSIWGMIAVGMFVEPDNLDKTFSHTYGAFKGGNLRILGVQVLTCVVISSWTVVVVLIQFLVIDKILGLRLSIEEEILGADAVEHDLDHSSHTINHQSKATKRNVVEPITLNPEIEDRCSTITDSEDQEFHSPKRVIGVEDETEMEVEYELFRQTKDDNVNARPRKINKPKVTIMITPPSRQANHLH